MNLMKQIILVLVVLFAGINLANGQIETEPEKYGFKVWTGNDVPDFEVTMTNGKAIKMKKLQGKSGVVGFCGYAVYALYRWVEKI